ncbi:MAG TPA: hypothetical protein VF021_10520 [Longimicrobiales bacterium]
MKNGYVVKRLGFRLTRGWFALIVIVGALAVAAFWIGPFRPLPAQLRLLALSGDGRFHEFVGVPASWTDTMPPASEATARFPLILAVHNAGSLAARPTRLSLSVPSRYRLTNRHGEPLRFHRSIGNPLVRYDLPVRTGVVEPRLQPAILGGLDTVYMEPIVPSIYCTTLSDSIPEFVSAPMQDPVLLSRIRVFYSFTGPAIRQRQTGLLTIQVDPNLVKREPAPPPPVYPTVVTEPEAPRPQMGRVKFVGSRSSWCGDPGQPVEIRDALYETADGGRFFMLYDASKPRKYLYDLNRDSIIELEIWDQDNDGKFESRRAAHLAIPAFLMPYREAKTDSLAADSAAVKVDTVQTTPQWLQTFYDTAAGPLRFAPAQPAKPAAAAPAGPAPAPLVPPARTETVTVPDTVLTRMDPAKVRLFNNTAEGPFRFYYAENPSKAPKRAAPRPRGPKLLGVPVESLKYIRRDTPRR